MIKVIPVPLDQKESVAKREIRVMLVRRAIEGLPVRKVTREIHSLIMILLLLN